MKEKQLLFVTYHDENLEEGLSYAIDLANTMKDGISILMVYHRKAMEKIGDMMSAVAFAEEDEHKTARELIMEDFRKKDEDFEKRVSQVTERCRKAGVNMELNTAAMDTLAAVRNLLRQNSRIDMVLLSPGVTNDGKINSKVLNRLVKTASRPVVTMSKQSHAG